MIPMRQMVKLLASFGIQTLLIVLLCGFSHAPAQTSPQGSKEPLILQRQSGKEKKIPQGARINVFGPKGTLPIRGRLHSVSSDSIKVKKLDGKTVVGVRTEEVTGIQRVIWLSILVGFYFGLSVLTSIAIGIVGLSLSGLPFAEAIGITLALSIPYIALVILFIWLGTRKYLKPLWKIKD